MNRNEYRRLVRRAKRRRVHPYVFLDESGVVLDELRRRDLVGEFRDVAGYVDGWDIEAVRRLHQWIVDRGCMAAADLDRYVAAVIDANAQLLTAETCDDNADSPRTAAGGDHV